MSARTDRPEPARVRIPADVDRPDRILAGLTARQLALLAVPAVMLWAGYVATRHLVPPVVFAAVGTPLAVAAVVLVMGRRDGVSLDRLLIAALRQARAPSRLVPAPEGVEAAPSWVGRDPAPPPAPLCLPVNSVGADGVVNLGGQGAALLCRASLVSFGLRTPAEQQALVATFARYLNALNGPVQFLVRSRPVDLSPGVGFLRDQAGGLPHPALEAAALAHAGFLEELAATRDLLARQLLVVFRDPAREPEAGARLRRRAEDAAAALGAAEIAPEVLGGEEAGACLRAATDPWSPPVPSGLGPFDAVVSGHGVWDGDAEGSAR